MSNSPAIRYAIYTRQSVERLADFSSCQAQFQTCQDYIAALHDHRLQWCGEALDDEGQSGATLDRPALRGLRQMVSMNGVKPPFPTCGGRSMWLVSFKAIMDLPVRA